MTFSIWQIPTTLQVLDQTLKQNHLNFIAGYDVNLILGSRFYRLAAEHALFFHIRSVNFIFIE